MQVPQVAIGRVLYAGRFPAEIFNQHSEAPPSQKRILDGFILYAFTFH